MRVSALEWLEGTAAGMVHKRRTPRTDSALHFVQECLHFHCTTGRDVTVSLWKVLWSLALCGYSVSYHQAIQVYRGEIDSTQF